jgi:hypothetical protein
MDKIRHMTFQDLLDLDGDEFEKTVIAEYKKCRPDNSVTIEQLDDVIEWAQDTQFEGDLLVKLLNGDGSVNGVAFSFDHTAVRRFSG